VDLTTNHKPTSPSHNSLMGINFRSSITWKHEILL